jgi:hypothetical protein
LLASLIFISIYGSYFNKNIEKIASKYDREIINKQMMNTKAIVYGNNNDDDKEYDEQNTTNKYVDIEAKGLVIDFSN